MYKLWEKLNELYGWLVTAFFAFVMLIGLWQCYDNYYIFGYAVDDDIIRYKPRSNGEGEFIGEESPITEEMVAWLTIDGTNIDYPVMQGSDNSHFLNTDPLGGYSLTGSIFLDCRCSPDFLDSYSLIYGHHMDYGKMFGALDDFLNETYLHDHSTGKLMVGRNGEEEYDLRVFAAMKASAREKTVFDLDEGGIRRYIRENAAVMTEESDADIVALSTCADANSVSRVVDFCYITK